MAVQTTAGRGRLPRWSAACNRPRGLAPPRGAAPHLGDAVSGPPSAMASRMRRVLGPSRSDPRLESLIRSRPHAPDQPILRSHLQHGFVDLAARAGAILLRAALLFIRFRELKRPSAFAQAPLIW